MAELWMSAGLLSVLLVGGLLLAWRKTARLAEEKPQRTRRNVDLYHEHLAELDSSLAAGQVDGARYQQLKLELDRRLLADAQSPSDETRDTTWQQSSRIMVAALLLLPLAALALYHQLGAAPALDAMAMLDELSAEPEGPRRNALLDDIIDNLEGMGQDDEGFRYLLANLYLEQGRAREAEPVITALAEHYPGDGELLALLFRARYQQTGSLTPDLRSLADRALSLTPGQTGLLGLVGMAAFQDGDYATAVRYWQRLKATVPADSEHAAMIGEMIAKAEARMGGDTLATAEPEAAEPVAAHATGSALLVSVSLGPGMKAAADEIVFVFARAAAGPPMPLAVARLSAGELPSQVRLDDTMAMSAGMSLSSFDQVEVIARVSRQGGVQAMPGDLEGRSGAIARADGESAVSVVIDRQIPAS